MDRLHIILVFMVVLLTQRSNHVVRCAIRDVRLVGGPTPDKGTVEIRIDNGTWETTCGINLGISDVIVICRQLGFTGANIAIQDTSYGQNSTPIRGLNCKGGEADLSECTLFPSVCSAAGGASCRAEGYLGCFRDQQNNRVLPGDGLTKDPHMTISYCIQFCNGSTTPNYIYAGVENGNECYCGEANARYYIHGVVSDAFCQVPCSGDPTESCGGSGFIDIFHISMVTPSTVSSSIRQTSIDNGNTAASSPPSMAPQATSAFPLTGNSTGLYAGIGGGVATFMIIVIILVIIFLMKRRSRKRQNDTTSSQRMSLASTSTPTGINGLGITNAALEETSAAGGSKIGLHASNNAAASVPTTSGGDKSGLLVNLNPRKSMNIYGGIDDEVQSDGMMPYVV